MRNLSSSSGKQSVGGKNGGMKRGPWTREEDQLLSTYINQHGEGQWRTLPNRAGLLRCGKSCRLQWMNYLRPCVKRGHISPDEEDLILRLHRLLGNRWSLIAGRIPGRTDNEIKNYWNTHLSKKLISQGIDPTTHRPLPHSSTTQNPLHITTWLTTCAADQHNNNNNLNVASSSRLPANPLNSVSAAQSDKNDQEYYCECSTEIDNDHFDLSIIAGRAKCLESDDDDDAFLSSLVNYEQLYEPADSSSHAFPFCSHKWD